MAPSSRDRISVDLRGMKAALVARAQARGLSPSDFVRSSVADALGQPWDGEGAPAQPSAAASTADRVRLSLRMSRTEVQATMTAARAAGMPVGAYVAGLVAGVPVLSNAAGRDAHIAALTASNAELSTLSRNLHDLTSLLRRGSVRAAQEYREMLDTVAQDVRGHLTLASAVLADLRPHRTAAQPMCGRRP